MAHTANKCHRELGYFVHRCSPANLETAGVHALVIGTASYPKSTLFGRKFHNLPGAAVGAARFARWLADRFRCPLGTPLLTVRVLLAPTKKERRSAELADIAYQPATRRNVADALQQWYVDCDSNPRNIAVLYLAGHGEANVGETPAVFLTGANRQDRYDESVNMTRVAMAMGRNNAYANLYIYDCCAVDPIAVAPGEEFAGVGLSVNLERQERREHDLHIAAARIGQSTYALGVKKGTILSTCLIPCLDMRESTELLSGKHVITERALRGRLKPAMQDAVRDRGASAPEEYQPRLRGNHDPAGMHWPRRFYEQDTV